MENDRPNHHRRLARSKDGATIHDASCRHARVPWTYADSLDADQLLDVKLRMGYRVCKVCQPALHSELDMERLMEAGV